MRDYQTCSFEQKIDIYIGLISYFENTFKAKEKLADLFEMIDKAQMPN